MYLGYYLQFYLFYLQARFWSYPLVIKLTIVIIVSIAIVFTINKLLFYLDSKRFIQKESTLRKLKLEIESTIDNILFNKVDLSEQIVFSTLQSIYPLKGSRRGLKILSKYLIQANLKSKFGEHGLNDKNYNQILKTFGVLNFWELELGSKNLNKIHRAKRNLDDLKQDYFQQLRILSTSEYKIDSPSDNPINGFSENNEPYKFLDESFINEFNALDEILVHRFFLSKAETGQLPLLSRWVRNSGNIAFKVFMIKEIGFFNQKGCASIIAAQLSKETNNDIILAIIETLTYMNYSQSETQILACYKSGNFKVKKSIIKSISAFKSKFGLEYLNELFFETIDEELRNHLLNAMKEIRGDEEEEGAMSINSISTFNSSSYRQINYQLS